MSLFPWALFRSTKSAVKVPPSWICGTHPSVYLCLRRQGARFSGVQAQRIFCHGSGLSRFSKAVSSASGRRILCQAGQVLASRPPDLLGCNRQSDRGDCRSSGYARGLLLGQKLSRTHRAHPIQRPRHRQDADVFDQQHRAASHHYCGSLQKSLAGRTVFQIDQRNQRIKHFFGTGENAVKTQI